jgi:hypothetical protein
MGQNALYWRTSESESSAQWLYLDSGGGGGGGGEKYNMRRRAKLLGITALHEPRFGSNN